jgi:hypothetical protein
LVFLNIVRSQHKYYTSENHESKYTQKGKIMPFEIIIGNLLKNDDLKRLINVEYKNPADREFVSYFFLKNKKLPTLQEMKHG